MLRTTVLALWLRLEVSDGTQPKWDPLGASSGYAQPQIYQKRPGKFTLRVSPLDDEYLFSRYPPLSPDSPTLQEKIC